MPDASLPLWAVYAVSFGVPAMAFAGGMAGVFVTRKGATELEKRSRREETMRNLRWAAELAVDADERKAQLGLAQLDALGGSDMLSEAEQLFVDAALASVVREPLEELQEAGPAAQVYRVSVQAQVGADVAAVESEEVGPIEGGSGA